MIRDHWAFVCEHCHKVNNIDKNIWNIKADERKRIMNKLIKKDILLFLRKIGYKSNKKMKCLKKKKHGNI